MKMNGGGKYRGKESLGGNYTLEGGLEKPRANCSGGKCLRIVHYVPIVSNPVHWEIHVFTKYKPNKFGTLLTHGTNYVLEANKTLKNAFWIDVFNAWINLVQKDSLTDKAKGNTPLFSKKKCLNIVYVL
jgi:hypothetical protein